jgi:hypothetical protein
MVAEWGVLNICSYHLRIDLRIQHLKDFRDPGRPPCYPLLRVRRCLGAIGCGGRRRRRIRFQRKPCCTKAQSGRCGCSRPDQPGVDSLV